MIQEYEQLPSTLSSEEQKELFRLYKTTKDQEIRETLITHNMRFVGYIASKYSNVPCDMDDIFQVGNIGLIQAVDHFKVDKGISFASFAYQCIHNEIRMFLRKSRTYSVEENSAEPLDFEKKQDNSDFERQIETYCEKKEQFQNLLSVMACLSKKEQDILTLYYYHNWSQEMIGQKYHVDRTTISKSIKTILVKLRTIMIEDELFQPDNETIKKK